MKCRISRQSHRSNNRTMLQQKFIFIENRRRRKIHSQLKRTPVALWGEKSILLKIPTILVGALQDFFAARFWSSTPESRLWSPNTHFLLKKNPGSLEKALIPGPSQKLHNIGYSLKDMLRLWELEMRAELLICTAHSRHNIKTDAMAPAELTNLRLPSLLRPAQNPDPH